MRSVLIRTTCILLLAFGATVHARDNDGGGGGSSGGFWCKLWCDIRHGSCEIPSGDPDIPPLKDPFCAERKAECKRGCGSQDPGGGLIIGARTPGSPFLISPRHDAGCTTPALANTAG